MEAVFTELNCESVRDVTVISQIGNKQQQISLNNKGVFRFTDPESGAIRVLRLPSIKAWVFCSLICDMLEGEDITREQDCCWEVNARDKYGRRYSVQGFAASFRKRPKYDPSNYLRKETGIRNLWLLDGKQVV